MKRRTHGRLKAMTQKEKLNKLNRNLRRDRKAKLWAKRHIKGVA